MQARYKITTFLLLLFCLLLLGCVENEATKWESSPTFTMDNMTLYGKKGTFGMKKMNGESEEPEFLAEGEGRLYHIYFLDTSKDFNGKKYKMMGTHEDNEESIILYEWDITNNESGAKFGFDKKGLWNIDILVDGKQYTSFVVEAKINQ